MPADPSSPSVIFVNALVGKAVDPDTVATLSPGWQTLIQAAQSATPVARRATLLLAKAGQANADRLLDCLRTPDPPDPDDPWPEPIPFGRPKLPEFPRYIFPSWLNINIWAEAGSTQTPVDLAAMLALAVLSTACAGRVAVNPWGDWIEPLNLFLMVALPPGHRKSAVFSDVVQPLQQFEADAAREAAPQIAHARRLRHAAEQALIRAEAALATASDDDQREQLLTLVQRRSDDLAALESPVVPRLIVDDCSPERLAMLLHQQGGRIAILSPEGGIFDLIAGRYSTTGAPNLDHILKGHAGDPIIVDRVGRPGEIISKPALTIGLAVQPEVLRGLANRPGFHGRGLLARFLYAVPNATLGRRVVDVEPVPDSLRADYRRQVLRLLTSLPPSPSPSVPSPAPIEPPSTRCLLPLLNTPMSSRAERACERSRGISAPETAGHPTHPQHLSPNTHHPATVLPFADDAADRLRTFAESVEPRLAPGADLDPIVDWASKLVGATARIAGLLHLAQLAPRLPMPELPPVSAEAASAAIIIAEYLIAHARAAYDTMGLDPGLAHAPVLLDWLRRTGPASFTRRDARRAVHSHIRSDADLDDALAELEAHGYLRPQPANYRFGRPRSPIYEVHPSLVRRLPVPPLPRTGRGG